METRRTLREERDIARTQRRAAIEQCDAAVKDAVIERSNVKRLAGQLSETRDELDALQRKHEADRPAPSEELRNARRALMLSERARASLDAQLVTVQAANDSLCREAVTRAGNLTTEATR